MAAQHRNSRRDHGRSARQLPSKLHLTRQIGGRAMTVAASCLVLALGACGVEAPEDIDVAACAAPEVYRIDRVELPRSHGQARALGLDLDRDGNAAADNQLGIVMSTLDGEFQPVDVVAMTNGRLATEVEWRLSLRACGARTVVSFGRADGLAAVQLVGDAGAGAVSARGEAGELPL